MPTPQQSPFPLLSSAVSLPVGKPIALPPPTLISDSHLINKLQQLNNGESGVSVKLIDAAIKLLEDYYAQYSSSLAPNQVVEVLRIASWTQTVSRNANDLSDKKQSKSKDKKSIVNKKTATNISNNEPQTINPINNQTTIIRLNLLHQLCHFSWERNKVIKLFKQGKLTSIDSNPQSNQPCQRVNPVQILMTIVMGAKFIGSLDYRSNSATGKRTKVSKVTDLMPIISILIDAYPFALTRGKHQQMPSVTDNQQLTPYQLLLTVQTALSSELQTLQKVRKVDDIAEKWQNHKNVSIEQQGQTDYVEVPL